jgi:hypothetical protein
MPPYCEKSDISLYLAGQTHQQTGHTKNRAARLGKVEITAIFRVIFSNSLPPRLRIQW